MRKRRLLHLAIVSVLSAPAPPALAHGGGLDASGCHTNRKTGDYHCHRGKRAPDGVDDTGRSCDRRPTCKQLRSCEDAMFYLRACGLGRLDGDGDGVPCENLCG